MATALLHCPLLHYDACIPPLISDVIQFIQEIQMTSFIAAWGTGTGKASSVSIIWVLNLGLEGYDAMDAWILLILDS